MTAKPNCLSGSEIGWSTTFEQCGVTYNKPNSKVVTTVIAPSTLFYSGLPLKSVRWQQMNLYSNGHSSTCYGYGTPTSSTHKHCFDTHGPVSFYY